jgi:hypothetical protein
MKIPGWLISLGLAALAWIAVRNGWLPIHGLLRDLAFTGVGAIGTPTTLYLVLDKMAKKKELR